MSALHDLQRDLAAHLRDPSAQPAPPGFDPTALAVYARLYRNNIAQLLAGNFPQIHAIVDRAAWKHLVAAFCRDRHVRTPLFPYLGAEFVRHLQAVDALDGHPWLADLARHEWSETELRIDPRPAPPHDHDGDVLAGVPVASPWLRVSHYDWPVQRIGPASLPVDPASTWLLARRDADGRVRFSELSPWTARLLALLVDNAQASGEQLVSRLATEAGCPDDTGFLADARALLLRMRAQGTLLGTHSGA